MVASRCASRHGPPGRRPKSTQPLTQHTTQYGISPSSATAKYRIQAAASRCLEAHAPPSRSPRLQHAHLLGETSARFRQPLAARWPPALGIDGWSNYLPFGNFTAFHARTRAGHVACTARRTRVEACHISTSSARMGHPGLTSHRTSCLFVVAIVPLAGKPRGVRWSCSAFPFFFPVSPSTSLPLSHLLHMRLPVPQLRSDRHPYPPDTRTAMLHLHHQTRHLTQSWPRLQPQKRGAETWRKQTIPPTRFPSALLPASPPRRSSAHGTTKVAFQAGVRARKGRHGPGGMGGSRFRDLSQFHSGERRMLSTAGHGSDHGEEL